MIEQEIIKQYPSLVARPYLLIKDDLQRKDMQRFWFENTISFLAVLSAAQLVQYYKELKSKEEKTDKELEIIQFIQEHKSLTIVGLEHMALGKWVMMLRETTKFLQELNAAAYIPELVNFYHGKNGKNNAKIIDKLVSIRNDDAHGNPIPEDKLKNELDKRQDLIDSLLDELTFLKNYQLLLPEKLEIEGSRQFYICKHFVGASIVNSKETFDFPPQLSDVMLINTSIKGAHLPLSPLLLYLGIQDEENNFLGTFSKYASKDSTEAKYLNLDGSATIDLVNFGQDQELDLISQRQSYSEIYSDPESFQVNLNITMKLEENIINIKDESAFTLSIDNKKSTDIVDIRVVLNIPKNIELILPIPEEERYKVTHIDNQLIFEFNEFEDNTSVNIEYIKFLVTEQGAYTFDGGQVIYSYYRTIADKESGQITEEDIQFEGDLIEAKDPNSRDKMVPVINITKGFVDEDDNTIQSVKIGEDFIFRVNVSNIGFSSAKDVTIDLVFPDNVSLKQGKETIKLGQLNPFEERTFKYVLTSHVPDIYTISMQNILYADSQRVRYATRCADDHFIIVRSDLIKEFVYNIKDHIDDLYIDKDEKENISHMIQTLDNSIDIQAYDVYKEAETEAVINIVRDLIEKVASKKDLKVVERVYEEGKRDTRITGADPRKFLVYSAQEMPFFAINLSKGYEPEFFSLRTNIDKRFNSVKIKQVVVGERSYTLDHCVDFNKIKYDEKYGKNFFSQWLNIVLTKFSKEYFTWKNLADHIAGNYGSPNKYISGQIDKNYEEASLEGGIGTYIILIDRNNSQNYYVSFSCDPTQNFKKIMQEYRIDKNYFTFLNKTSGKERVRLYNSKELSFYMQISDSEKLTRYPAINLSIRDEKSMQVMLEKTKALWNNLCMIHSLDLLDNDNFKDQKFMEEIKVFINALFLKGFAVRQNAKDEDMLDIYSLKHFKPHTATERDCIGFFKKYRSSWQLFLDFFTDDIDMELASKLSLISTNTILDKVRWIKIDVGSKEDLKLVTDAILKQTELYEAHKLAIWPKKIQKAMILNQGQTDSGFFIILKNLLSGINKYDDILLEFKSLSMDKELDRTLKRSELFDIEAGYEIPLYADGEGEDKIVTYNSSLEETLQSMYEEKPLFDYLEEGPALFRIRTKQVTLKYEYLFCRAPFNSGMVDNTYKAKNKYFDVCWFILNPQKGSRYEFALAFYDCKENVDEIIRETYSDLNNKFNNELAFGRSGRKNQHIKVSYTYTFDNFDEELIKIQTICHDFFTKAEEGIKKLNEKAPR